MFFGLERKREPLAPQLTGPPPGPLPCLPTLFLGVSGWFVESCDDVLRNDLVFSTRAKAIHPVLKDRMEQVLILNFLSGKDVLTLSKALRGGSAIVTEEELLSKNGMKIATTDRRHKHRGVIVTDDWFDVDRQYRKIANAVLKSLKPMYETGSSVIVAATMGVFIVPRQLNAIFGFDSPSSAWTLVSYTSKSIITTPVGKQILGTAFPDKEVYTKAHYVQAPEEECLFVEFVNPDEYDSYDSDEIPQPGKDSPLVVHKGRNGGILSYFGFVNSLDVSYGAIMLQLVNQSKMTASGVKVAAD